MLENYSTDELKKELDKREKKSNIKPIIKPTTELETIVIKNAEECLDYELTCRELDHQYMYEAIMQHVYGDDVFIRIYKARD